MISFTLLLTLVVGADTARQDAPRLPTIRHIAIDAPADTTPQRARAIEVSEWYHRRLLLHRYLAYAAVPVFTMQYIAGNELYDQSTGPAPRWAKPVHQTGAATVAGIFTINTITGVWNLWDSRKVTERRWVRYAHAVSMIGADVAFAYTGLKLAQDAGNNLDRRKQHRNTALASMGVTVASGVMMKVFGK